MGKAQVPRKRSGSEEDGSGRRSLELDLWGNPIEPKAEEVVLPTRTKPDLFKQILPSITTTKTPVELSVKSDYPAYMVNKALSMSVETIFYANEMNKNWQLENIDQYNFHLHAIRKGSRFSWFKGIKIENLDLISECYNVSKEKAKDILRLLSPEQIEKLRESRDQGGT